MPVLRNGLLERRQMRQHLVQLVGVRLHSRLFGIHLPKPASRSHHYRGRHGRTVCQHVCLRLTSLSQWYSPFIILSLMFDSLTLAKYSTLLIDVPILGGVCVQVGNLGYCACKSGFSGATCSNVAGTTTSAVFSCSVTPCTNGGVCVTTAQGEVCACPNGYSLLFPPN